MKNYIIISFLSLLTITPVSAREITYFQYNPIFEVPPGLEAHVKFWKDIYTKYTSDHIVIHDENNLDIIYGIVDIREEFNTPNPTDRMKRRKIREIRRRYVRKIKRIVRGNIREKRLSEREKQIYNMLKSHYSGRKLRRAYINIRTQVGQQDRFMEGLKKSGLYIDKMKSIFMSFGLPVELTVLPHVESSFNYDAYSRFGAAGIWQFTRSTGRRFMKINYEIDERRDPIISTIAAAKLLKENYKELGNWPLAITAYNHGLYGMKRAKRLIGDNIVDIIKRYRSRRFGFASKNFYAEFLAALDVMRNYRKYFGDIEIYNHLGYDILKLDHYIEISTLSHYLNISKEDIHFLNPSLRPSILESNKFIPKGFNLKIPKGKLKEVSIAYANIPPDKKFSRQKRSKWYRVRRGDTLIRIARMFSSTVGQLKRLNNLVSSHRIYPGEILQIPPTTTYMTTSVSSKERGEKGEYQYIVKRGDSLSRIALRFGVGLNDIKSKNNINNINLLREGDVINIPAGKRISENILVDTVQVGGNSPQRRDKVDSTTEWIVIGPDETIGHYGDWLNLPTWRLRRLNKLGFRESIRIGQMIMVSFEHVSPEEFERRRKEYHRSIEEDFFSNYKIEKTITYILRKGDTVWDICNEYEIPYWLLKGYNSERDLSNLIAGETLLIPVASKIE